MTPVTTPVVRPTVATVRLLLIQVPVPPSVNKVVDPTHILRVPSIGPGAGFTVTTPVTLQVVDKV